MTTKTAPAGSTEIWTDEDDSYAPHALIGYIAPADYPAGEWIAILPDLDDIMHDPQPIKDWRGGSRSAEAAEAKVRAHYERWLAKQA